jgi:integrase
VARPQRKEKFWLVERNGVYSVAWYDEALQRTKRQGLRTRDRDEANLLLHDFAQKGEAVHSPDGRDAGLTCSAALDDYFREHVAKNVEDKVRQEIAIRHLKAYFGDMLLKRVDKAMCRGYAEARKVGAIGTGKGKGANRKGADSTIRRELAVLRSAANHARGEKRIGLNEMPTFELPAEPKVQQEEGFYSKFQIATLIFMAEGDLRDFILLAYAWGARRASVEKLHVDQVFLERGYVNLLKPGARETSKRKPRVPITPTIRAALAARYAKAKAGNGWLFGSEGVDFYKRFNEHATALGYDLAHPHALRHSRATHLLMDGHDEYKVARLIGDTVETLRRVYGHHSTEYLAEGLI